MQQLFNRIQISPLLYRYQLVFSRHNGGHRGIHMGFKTHIAAGDNADQIPVIQYRHTGDIVLLANFKQAADGLGGINGNRIFNNSAFMFFNNAHLISLLFNGHALVNDTNASFLSHGNRQTGLSHGIHGRRNQRDIELNISGEPGFQADVLGSHLRVTGQQENIIKSEGLFDNSQHK